MNQLEIHIHEKESRGYKVEIRLFEDAGPRDLGHGYLHADNIAECPSDNPMAAGQWLRAWLLKDEALKTAWDKAREAAPQCRIRLWIEQGATELHTLPWEMLPISTTVIAAMANTPFSRYLPSQESWGRSLVKGRLRVLVAISNPNDLQKYDLTPINVKRERAALESALSTRGLRQLDVDFLETPVTLERLEARLRERRYHVVHYLGHGNFNRRRNQTSLYLQDAAGNTHVTEDTEIVQLFENLADDYCPRLVFLNACEGAKTSTTDAFRGLGQQLVLAGIPAVVAMQEKISMGSARKLSATFYRRLLATGVVDQAMNEARSTLMAAGRSDVAVPVLFMRLKNGKLFNFQRVDRHQRVMRYATVVMVCIVSAIIVYAICRPAPPLTGSKFNIAISRFSAGEWGLLPSSRGGEMALYLKDILRSEMSNLGYSPEQVGIGVYRGVGAREKRAEALLEDITRKITDDEVVTLLIYGYEPESNAYRVYFQLHNLREGAEVRDEFLNRSLNQETKGEITAQSDVLVAFTSGLVNLYNGDLSDAKAHFEEGIAEAEAADLTSALDTLNFFQGRVLAALGQPDAARSAYNTALDYNPDYAMAHIGLGNLIYNEAAQICVTGDRSGCERLDLALEEYQLAMDSSSRHYMTWVEGKVYINIGNVYSLQGQVLGDISKIDEAIKIYEQAQAAYEHDDASTEYLSKVYYVRGLAYERRALLKPDNEQESDFEKAISDYTWCEDNAGTRYELAQKCSQRKQDLLGKVED